MTIVEAIISVLKSQNTPLTYKQIYNFIIENNLYSFGAKSPESIVNNKLRKHCFGLDFPSASPEKFFIISSIENETRYFLYDKNINEQIVPKIKTPIDTEKLPEEKLEDAYTHHREGIKISLLEQILQSPPSFFERLVVDLLLAMGYGGDFKDAGIVQGGTGDGGIDGVIKEDKLGLDKIYIQAKRYTDKKVGRPELQQFVGAMENVQKGVFITTSGFSAGAIEYSKKQQKNIALIDGSVLCDLMVTHGVGVSKLKTYTTFRVDSDYFSDN